MLTLVVRVRLESGELPLLEGAAARATSSDFRDWLEGASSWQLQTIQRSRGGAWDLEIRAVRRGAYLAGVALAIERLLETIPFGDVVELSLTAEDDEPLLERREGAFPVPGRVCEYCNYPAGRHAANCPMR